MAALTWVAHQTLQDQMLLNELRREHLGWSAAHKQELGLFSAGAHAPQHGYHVEKDHQRHLQASQVERAKVMVPENPSTWTLLGLLDSEILKVAETSLWGAQHTTPLTAR